MVIFIQSVVGGSGVGVVPKHIGFYSMELYFYSDNHKIKDTVMNIDWKEEVNSISAKKLPKGLALEIINNKISESNLESKV